MTNGNQHDVSGNQTKTTTRKNGNFHFPILAHAPTREERMQLPPQCFCLFNNKVLRDKRLCLIHSK